MEHGGCIVVSIKITGLGGGDKKPSKWVGVYQIARRQITEDSNRVTCLQLQAK